MNVGQTKWEFNIGGLPLELAVGAEDGFADAFPPLTKLWSGREGHGLRLKKGAVFRLNQEAVPSFPSLANWCVPT